MGLSSCVKKWRVKVYLAFHNGFAGMVYLHYQSSQVRHIRVSEVMDWSGELLMCSIFGTIFQQPFKPLKANRLKFLYMMTSSNFRVTGHLCGEFTGPSEFPTQRPATRSCDVFFDLRLNKRLSKQSWNWWFETLSRPLWRHCNEQPETTNQERKSHNAFVTNLTRHLKSDI